MSVPRRLPPTPEEREAITRARLTPGALRGRTRFAAPVVDSQRLQSMIRAAGSPSSTSQVQFQRDAWTLAAGGAQTETLTYLPLAGSEHVYLNGVEQAEGTDWSRSGQTLSVLTAMDARVGDFLEVRYAYLVGSPLTVSPPLVDPTGTWTSGSSPYSGFGLAARTGTQFTLLLAVADGVLNDPPGTVHATWTRLWDEVIPAGSGPNGNEVHTALWLGTGAGSGTSISEPRDQTSFAWATLDVAAGYTSVELLELVAATPLVGISGSNSLATPSAGAASPLEVIVGVECATSTNLTTTFATYPSPNGFSDLAHASGGDATVNITSSDGAPPLPRQAGLVAGRPTSGAIYSTSISTLQPGKTGTLSSALVRLGVR